MESTTAETIKKCGKMLPARMGFGMSASLFHAMELLKHVEDCVKMKADHGLTLEQQTAVAASLRDSTNIYFIGDVEAKRVKIGRAKDVQSRFTSIQTGNPAALTIFAYVRSHEAFEKAMHLVHKGSHIRGEWFRLTNNVVESIKAAQEGPSRFAWHAIQCMKSAGIEPPRQISAIDEGELKKVVDRYRIS